MGWVVTKECFMFLGSHFSKVTETVCSNVACEQSAHFGFVAKKKKKKEKQKYG